MNISSLLKPNFGTENQRWRVACLVLSAVLICAACLKAWELANPLAGEAPVLRSQLPEMCLVLFELGWGLWLLTGLQPRWTHAATLTLFILFFEVSLYQFAAGKSHCACMGNLHPSPWIMASLDLSAVLGLALINPGKLSHSAGIGLNAFFLGYAMVSIPIILTITYYSSHRVLDDLRKDTRLAGQIALDLRNPDTTALLAPLQKETGLSLVVDPSLESTGLDYGRIGPTNLKAWVVMEMVAENQRSPAYWEKTEEGYHLRNAAVLGSRVTPWWISAGLGGTILLGISFNSLRQRSLNGELAKK